MPVNSGHIGNFVQTELGIGRLVSINDGRARVRFFRAPSRDPFIDETLDASPLQPVVLAPHTRMYLHNGHRWRIGRIEDQHPTEAGQYLVAFPNGEGTVLPSHAFDVRWANPLEDPYEILASAGGDSPMVYQCRLDVLSNWSQQRRLGAGVEGLLLGSVDLHAHQLEVVRRVAQDPVKRYILADEVGLGKTIEASALIWQLLKRRPDAHVLILVPAHLRKQWAEELVHRFRADQFPKAKVLIHGHTDASNWPSGPQDLLVIDEAHHVTRTGATPNLDTELLTTLAHQAEELLLLSATPVRSNEAGFLDLLHLLDPQHYKPDDLAAFTRRVALRDQLALICQSLEPDLDDFDLSLYAGELRGLFPDDGQLTNLLDMATTADDASRSDAILRLREHLSESYRLHHRLLRTRREGSVEREFSVRGRRRAIPFILSAPDSTGPKREALLDTLRELVLAAVESGGMSEREADDVFRDVAARCGSLLPALASLLTPLGDLDEAALPALAAVLADDDRQLLARELHHLASADPSQTVSALVAHLTRLAGADGKKPIVIATQYTEVGEQVSRALGRHIGARRVAEHLKCRDARTNNASLARWLAENDCSVLICDSGAEEGLNLQQAELLIHLDLPWQASRVEQRIGRCDRHAPSVPRPIPSMVITYGQQSYAQSWLELLSDGADVFGRSVSSLQYVLADLEARVVGEVLRRGYEAIEAATDAYAESLKQELTKIKAHDALDSVQSADVEHSISSARLIAQDRDPTMTKAFITWLEGVGARVIGTKAGVITVPPRRLQVPLGLELALAPAMGKPLALNRGAAVRERLPLPRAGHSQLDAVAQHLLTSDRGVAFAVYRPARDQWPPRIALRTDFLLTPTLSSDVTQLADERGALAWLEQMLNEAYPPTVVSVAMDPLGEPIDTDEVRRVYEQRAGDLNLTSRPQLFRQLTQHLDWENVCGLALQRARDLLAIDAATNDLAVSAAADLRRGLTQRIDRQQARLRVGSLVDEAGPDLGPLLSALPHRIDNAIVVLGCGAVLSADRTSLDEA